MNRMDRIVLDPVRTYACTRTARTGVRVTAVSFDLSQYRGGTSIKVYPQYERTRVSTVALTYVRPYIYILRYRRSHTRTY